MGNLLKIQVIRHVDTEGRRVPKGTPGARAVKEKSSKWYGQYTGADGKRRRVPLCTDKGAALQMLATLERKVARGEAGLDDPYEAHRKAPVEDHVVAYESHLRDQVDVSPKHLKETMRRLRYVLDACGASKLADVQTDAVGKVLRDLAQRGAAKKPGPGASARTRNLYLSSVRAFTRWCWAENRIAADPLVAKAQRTGKGRKGGSHHLTASGETRRRRRALTDAELVRLLTAARERPLREARTIRTGERRGEVVGNVRDEVKPRLERLGWERCLMYKTLVLTGLRRGELAALRVEHLSLDGAKPMVILPPEVTKNGEKARLRLRADLVKELADWIATTGSSGQDLVFRVPVELVKILKRDLAVAGIPFRDERGKTVDIHALRHTTATNLSRAKVAPKLAQKMLRHSDIKLTLQVYTDEDAFDEGEALEAMPQMTVLRADGVKDKQDTGPT